MIVYRLEHKTSGDGPYRHDYDRSWRKGDHAFLKRTPIPQLDILEWEFIELGVAKYRFGFKSLKQLSKWFLKTELKELKKRGFVIRKYEVDKEHVLFGSKQVAFLKRKAVLCQQFTPGNLLRDRMLKSSAKKDLGSTC